MNKFVIIADATCDLDINLQKKYDVIIVDGHLYMPGFGDIPSFLDWNLISREDFYANLKNNPNDYKTSPANAKEFADIFEKYLKEGYDILAMTISTGISGAFGFANIASNEMLAKYRDAKIRIVDSLRFGPCFGLMVMYASDLRKQGKSLEETYEWLENNKNCFHQAGWLDDLSFVAKKGRINNASAFFGTLIGIKPIGEIDSNGLTTVIGKAKGAKNAYKALLAYMEKTIIDPQNQIIVIAQSDRMTAALQYQEMIREKFKPQDVIIKDVYPSCGINIGPGLMAAYYYGKPISAGLEEERAIIEEVLG